MRTVLFVCLHGSAKSLIAAEHLNRLAHARALPFRAESAALEPDEAVPAAVVAGLAGDGIDVRNYTPRRATRERLAVAHQVVSMGCDIAGVAPEHITPTSWDNLPMVSDGYAAARNAIVERLGQLLDELTKS
jgi:arsenate reductase